MDIPNWNWGRTSREEAAQEMENRGKVGIRLVLDFPCYWELTDPFAILARGLFGSHEHFEGRLLFNNFNVSLSISEGGKMGWGFLKKEFHS